MALGMEAGPDRRWEQAAGVLSLIAGGIHGAITPDHFAEWWGYGVFFVFATVTQVLFGLALLTRAINPEDTGPSWRSIKRALYWAGIAGNMAIIALYAVTRTVGIPFFGPEAGEIEPVAAIDVASKVFEVVLIGVLGLLLFRMRGVREESIPVPA